MMALDRQLCLQFLRYLSVGGTTAILYLALIFIGVQLLQLGHLWAVSIAYLCAVTFHFLANKTFTFQSRNGKIVQEALRYSLTALANYLITLAIVYVVVDWAHLSTYLGACLAIAVTYGVGYAMTRFWVFNHRRGTP